MFMRHGANSLTIVMWWSQRDLKPCLEGHRIASTSGADSEGESPVDRKLDEFRVAFEPKLLHDAVFVKGDRAGRDMQDAGSFLHRIAFCE